MKPHHTILVIAAVGLALSCVGKQAPREKQATEDAERAAVERAVRDCFLWALDKDRPRLEAVIAADENYTSFTPERHEPTIGWAAFQKKFDFWMDPRFVATSFELRELRIHFSRAGDVAWFSGELDDCYTWDGEPGCWKDTRWTGVLEKRERGWVIVQQHFSFAAERVRARLAAKE